MRLQEAMDELPMVQSLAEPARRALLGSASVRNLSRGERMFTEGDPSGPFSFVLSGRVKLFQVRGAGREVMLEVVGPGQLLCGNAVYAGAKYCCSATAVENDTRVVSLPREPSITAFVQSPEAARRFLDEVTCRGMTLCQRVGEVACGRVEQRIASLLLRLADSFGEADGEHEVIAARLSRQDLADLCGTTVETTIRAMRRLERAKVLDTTAAGFVVRDRSRLSRVASGQPPEGLVGIRVQTD